MSDSKQADAQKSFMWRAEAISCYNVTTGEVCLFFEGKHDPVNSDENNVDASDCSD